MHADYFAMTFDLEHDLFKTKNFIKEVEDDSQTISRLPVVSVTLMMTKNLFSR
jgi:hypothetical protein